MGFKALGSGLGFRVRVWGLNSFVQRVPWLKGSKRFCNAGTLVIYIRFCVILHYIFDIWELQSNFYPTPIVPTV